MAYKVNKRRLLMALLVVVIVTLKTQYNLLALQWHRIKNEEFEAYNILLSIK